LLIESQKRIQIGKATIERDKRHFPAKSHGPGSGSEIPLLYMFQKYINIVTVYYIYEERKIQFRRESIKT